MMTKPLLLPIWVLLLPMTNPAPRYLAAPYLPHPIALAIIPLPLPMPLLLRLPLLYLLLKLHPHYSLQDLPMQILLPMPLLLRLPLLYLLLKLHPHYSLQDLPMQILPLLPRMDHLRMDRPLLPTTEDPLSMHLHLLHQTLEITTNLDLALHPL